LDERAQKLLTQYGLTDRESLVYLSLLANGRQSAGEIAKAVQIRRMEAYRIIKKLADSGVVIAAPGNPVKYTGEPIEQVVEGDPTRPIRSYNVSDSYRAGDRIAHPKLGAGVVQGSAGPGKIRVRFDERQSVLVHERSA